MRLTFNNDKEFIEKLTEIVITNLDNDKFGVDELVHASGLSHATVLHKIKSISQKTISQFICEIRLDKALEILQNETLTSAEVAYKVGFESLAYFNSCFHEYFGYTPGEVKKKLTFKDEIIENESNNKSNIFKSLKRLFAKRTLLIRVSQIFIALVILLLAHMAFFDFPIKFGNEKTDSKMSIAVLPFKNLSNEKEYQYLADGITEGITKRLNKLGNLKVISRTSSEHFRESNKSIPQIAKELDVNYILEGSVQCDESKARISVQLIDADKDQHILSEQFDRELENIFALQSNIVRQVAERLQMTLTTEEIAKIEKVPTENREAYNYYLLGRFFCNKRTKEGLEKSIAYFEKAIETDNLYALAYAGLADALFIQAWWGWGEKVLEFNPENKAVYNTISQNYFELKNDSMAVEAIKNSLAANTSNLKHVPIVQDIYAKSGANGVLMWLAEREKTKKQPDAFSISRIYCRIGDKQNALMWLETGYINHSTRMPRITVDPGFDILRSEPRFLKIIDEMELTTYHKRKPKQTTNS